MRPLYRVLKPKLKGRYTQIRHSVKKRLYSERIDASTEMQPSTRNPFSKDGRDWGLRVPGSQTMKTIDLSMARTHESDCTSISRSDNKDDRRVIKDWV